MISLFVLTGNNPYQALALQHIAGLTTITGSLTPSMSYDDLATSIVDYVKSVYFPTPDIYSDTELPAIVGNSINVYTDGILTTYNETQCYYIELLINGIRNTPPNRLQQFAANFDKEIFDSGLSIQERAPLLFCSAIINISVGFWISQIDSPTSPYYTNGYFSTQEYENYISISNWMESCVFGVLSSANLAKTYGQLDPPRVIGVDLVSALTGSLSTLLSNVILKYSRTSSLDFFDKPIDGPISPGRIVATAEYGEINGHKFVGDRKKIRGPVTIWIEYNYVD